MSESGHCNTLESNSIKAYTSRTISVCFIKKKNSACTTIRPCTVEHMLIMCDTNSFAFHGVDVIPAYHGNKTECH